MPQPSSENGRHWKFRLFQIGPKEIIPAISYFPLIDIYFDIRFSVEVEDASTPVKQSNQVLVGSLTH
ncbi:hypothetical protein CHS0354_001802 [Potamilus streckersoni]|uniref:Uncharacterized protein n=1 Tax=Potamilus streckersoni TaxID=2493646 RepID=A0AAE0S4I8_9BIVA|nr:hypothetical protein CHS0354_001802 [Potamilus streckersoni]